MCHYTPGHEVQALLRLFESVPGDIVEIGCNEGHTTRALALHFPNRRVYAVDWTGRPTMTAEQLGERPTADRLCIEARDLPNVTVFDNLSEAVMPPPGVRCVFIDGDHSLRGVTLDSQKWMQHIHQEGAGIVVWHDVYDGAPDWVAVGKYLESNVPAAVKVAETRMAYWKLWQAPQPVVLSGSETAKVRDSLARFCEGNGLDIGFGGDPIVPHAICMDLPTPYARYLPHTQHLHGDANNLHWFRDDRLDWVYSSHVLEDFHDTLGVLGEWIRVVRPGGNVVLYLPDQQTYLAYCRETGLSPNLHHVHEHFGLPYLKNLLATRPGVEIVHERFPVGVYSFELVLKKLI